MSYQLRNFEQIGNLPFKLSQQLVDIYIHKNKWINIGIKIRQPKQQSFSWESSSFDCKIMTEKHGILQKWYKFRVESRQKLTITKQLEKQTAYKISKLNQHLCQSIHSSQYLKHYQQLKKWCQQQISQIFVVRKRKHKIFGHESGTLSVQRILHDPKMFYFQTMAHEDDQPKAFEKVLSSWKQGNTSYPELMQKLLSSKFMSKQDDPSFFRETQL